MNSPIFKDLPKVNDFEVQFALKEELLLDWLLGLSKNPARDACNLLLQFLQTFNKAEAAVKTRIFCLKNSYEYLKQYISHLEGSCWDASLPLSEKELDYAEAIAWNYLALAEGFFIAAQDSTARVDELFALYMSCHCLRQAQLHIAAVYNSPNGFFWSLTYQVFAWTEKYKLSDTEINDSDLKEITLNSLFAQIFIFQVCDITQFRPRDMQTVFNFLPKVCDKLTIYKLSDIKFQTEFLNVSYIQAVTNSIGNSTEKLAELLEKRLSFQKDLFVFDVNQALPPAIINQTYSYTAPSLRYFTAAGVAENLEHILNAGEIWRGILKSINNELFTRVIKTLEPGAKRKHVRCKTEQNMLGVIGFECIAGFLYKISRKTQLANAKLANTQAPVADPTSYEELTAYAHQAKRQVGGVIGGGFLEMDFELQSNLDQPVWNSKTETDITQSPVTLKRLAIFDSSARGYSVHWADNQNSKAKVGDIFGIISEDKKRLEIAIIRRIIMQGQQDYKFGTEVLGFESELVMITHADNQSTGKWGIFIPGSESLNQVDTVVYAIGHFQEGDFVYIYKSNKTIKALLKKGLNATAAIVHVELDYAASALMEN